FIFFFSSRRRHTRFSRDWSSDVCSSDLHLSELRFAELPLSAELQRGIAEAGFTNCTPIQSQTLPIAIEGHDVAGQAQTGTGKTRSEERRVGKECRSRW